MLGGGRWNGRQVEPESWITRATTPAVTIEGDFKYGYHWYIGMRPDSPPQSPPRFIAGIGWGGQRLHLSPARDLVIVIHCGNYARPAREQRSVIDAVMTQVLLPSFV
jgi:CubicO group peptidase (beta-lactamase class C family)